MTKIAKLEVGTRFEVLNCPSRPVNSSKYTNLEEIAARDSANCLLKEELSRK
jgi:hypothetical protein